MSQRQNKYIRDWEKYVEVEVSPIHGKGIFASTEIPTNELVMIIMGETISGDECERREEENNNVYIFYNGNYYIDTVMTDKIKYINHNCKPNCIILGNDDDSLLLVSDRVIKEGEEITMDYGYDEIYDKCNCASCSE